MWTLRDVALYNVILGEFRVQVKGGYRTGAVACAVAFILSFWKQTLKFHPVIRIEVRLPGIVRNKLLGESG